MITYIEMENIINPLWILLDWASMMKKIRTRYYSETSGIADMSKDSTFISTGEDKALISLKICQVLDPFGTMDKDH